MNRTNAPYPTILQAFALLGVFLLATLGVFIPILGISELLGVDDPSTISSHPVFTILGYSIPMLFVIRQGLKRVGGFRRLDLGKSFTIWELILAWLACFSLIIPTNDLVFEFLPGAEALYASYEEIAQPSLATFITAILLAPVLEEILFRGIILKGFLHQFGSWKAILLSAALFGVFHLHPLQMINAFAMGVVLGFAFWRTGSLGLAILLHLFNNALSFFSSYADEELSSFRDDLGNDLGYLLLLIGLYGVSFICMRTLYRITSVN